MNLIATATQNGGVTAENLFDAFMDKYRGKVAYTPDTGGTVLDGYSNANCQDLTGAFIRVLSVAGLKGGTAPVLESYYITAAVDNKWIDSNALGNINYVDKNEHRYFFSEHWVVEQGGKKFCPTTGRKGAEINNTVWKKTGNIAKGKSVKFDDFKFSNYKGKEGKNDGMIYRLEVKN